MSHQALTKIEELEGLLEQYPYNARARLILADLLARHGENRRAIYHYSYLAALYLQEEHDLKAIALLKLILRLDPRNLGIRETLAKRLHKLDRLGEAHKQYRRLVREYGLWGRRDKSLATVHRILDMDPGDEWARTMLYQLAPAN